MLQKLKYLTNIKDTNFYKKTKPNVLIKRGGTNSTVNTKAEITLPIGNSKTDHDADLSKKQLIRLLTSLALLPGRSPSF